MGISKDVSHVLFMLLFLLSVFLGGALIKLFLIPAPETPPVWDEYRVYAFVSAGSEAGKGLTEKESAEIGEIFSTHGYTEIISRKEEKVHVFTYGGMERKEMSELESIYDPLDPLYDPYMQTLPKYYFGNFNGREAELFYVPDRAETITKTFTLHRDLLKTELMYTSSDSIPGARIFTSVLFFCIFLIFLFVLRREGIVLFLLGGLTLFPGVVSGSFLYLSQTVLLLAGWAAALALGKKAFSEYSDIKSERSRKECIKAVMVYAVFSAASLCAGLLSHSHGAGTLFLQQLSSILVHTSLAAAYAVYRKYSSRKREHIPFYPESIKPAGAGGHRTLLRGTAAVLGCMCAAPFLYAHLIPGGELVIPKPVEQSGGSENVTENYKGFSWASLERFAEAKKTEDSAPPGNPSESEESRSTGNPSKSEAKKTEDSAPPGNPSESEESRSAGNPSESEESRSAGNPSKSEESRSTGNPSESEESRSAGNPSESEESLSPGNPSKSEESLSPGNPSESEESRSPESSSPGAGFSALPDISDYISHRAFQEGFFFGRPYGFPAPEEEIRLDGYVLEENRVIPKDRVVKMFTDDWYEDIIVEAYNGGVTRLLLSQDGPVKVQKQKVRLPHITENTLWIHMGTYAVVFLFFIFIQNRKRTQKFISKENIVMRKGRKVA